MILQTINRAVNILKFEKSTYLEISSDKNSILGSGLIIVLAALVNLGLFQVYILPNLPTKIPPILILLVWIFFNWFIFSMIILKITKIIGGKQNINNKKIALSFIGFSNTAEILKIVIIFLPNFIVLISWAVLMLVIASQVLGVKQIYNLNSTAKAVAVILFSYLAQFLLIGFIVFFLIILAH
tara:strand:- start:554 stop:1102 length:549 start_codon:yes stop_codon:yes gene_type:complete